MSTKLFDLHIEVGVDNNGGHYAKTILGNNAILIEKFSGTLCSAVINLIYEMDQISTFDMLKQSPTLSRFPLGAGAALPVKYPPTGTGTHPTTKPSTKPPAAVPVPDPPDPNIVRQRPADLGKIDSPACNTICISFDHFGTSKCKSICASKKGV